MAIRISNTPTPLTATFRENVSPWNYLYMPLVVGFLTIMGAKANVFVVGIFLFYGVLFTVVPIGRGAIVEVSSGEVTWKKTFFGSVWRTRRTTIADIFTIRWIQQRWPWYSRYRIPSHILVKLRGGGNFKFASTITLQEFGVLQRAFDEQFPDLYRVTENAFEE